MWINFRISFWKIVVLYEIHRENWKRANTFVHCLCTRRWIIFLVYILKYDCLHLFFYYFKSQENERWWIFVLRLSILSLFLRIRNFLFFILFVSKYRYSGRDRIVVGFKTTYAISACHHQRCDIEPRSGEVYSMQHYVIKLTAPIILKYCWK